MNQVDYPSEPSSITPRIPVHSNFRERYYKVRVLDRMAKDDMAIFDSQKMTVHNAGVHLTQQQTEERIAEDVRDSLSKNPQQAREIVKINRDRELLLISYGAMIAIDQDTPGLRSIIEMIEAELWPGSSKAKDGLPF